MSTSSSVFCVSVSFQIASPFLFLDGIKPFLAVSFNFYLLAKLGRRAYRNYGAPKLVSFASQLCRKKPNFRPEGVFSGSWSERMTQKRLAVSSGSSTTVSRAAAIHKQTRII